MDNKRGVFQMKTKPKSPAAKGGRAKNIKARKMWASAEPEYTPAYFKPDRYPGYSHPVFVLPASDEACEQMAVTLSKDRARRFKQPNLWMCYLPHARADLASLGLLPLKRGRGK